MNNLLKMREPVNTWTHLLTFAAALAGLVWLIILTNNDLSKLITLTIYGASVITLYGASFLYHWIEAAPRQNLILRKLDHMAIYLLIAGSYTPVFYYGLSGAWKWAMLTAVWVLAITGVCLKIWFTQAPRYVSAVFYLILGWIALVPLVRLFDSLPAGAMALMFAGGVLYTVGALIYATKCFDFFPHRFGFHEIFHLFVMAGSIVHYLMMVRYIVPL